MRILAFLLVLSLTLAGCGEDPEPASEPENEAAAETDTSTETEASTSTGTQTTAPTPGEDPEQDGNESSNTPPTAALTADVQSGDAPLVVAFDLDGTDADGDAINWTFDADGDGVFEAEGAELPANTTFTFDAGSYNATLTVDDGQNQTTSTLAIEVAEVEAPAGPFEPVTLTQDRLLSCPAQCFASDATGDSGCVGVQAGENGLDCAWFELDPAWEGRTWTVDGSLLSIVEFYPDCSGTGRLTAHVGETSGQIPAGAGCFIEWDPIDPVVTISLTIS